LAIPLFSNLSRRQKVIHIWKAVNNFKDVSLDVVITPRRLSSPRHHVSDADHGFATAVIEGYKESLIGQTIFLKWVWNLGLICKSKLHAFS